MTAETIRKRLDRIEAGIPGKDLTLELTSDYSARIGSPFDDGQGEWMTRPELIELLERGGYQTVGGLCSNPVRWFYDHWRRFGALGEYTAHNEIGADGAIMERSTLLDAAREYEEAVTNSWDCARIDEINILYAEAHDGRAGTDSEIIEWMGQNVWLVTVVPRDAVLRYWGVRCE